MTTVKNQIIQQNKFLEQTGLVPILNIHSDIMNSGLKERLIAIPSIIGLEFRYIPEKSERPYTHTSIDQIKNDIIFTDSQVDKPGR